MLSKRRGVILFALIALAGGTLWLLFGRTPIEEGRCKLTLKTVTQPSELTGVAYRFLDEPTSNSNDIGELPKGFDLPFYHHIRASGGDIPLVVNGGDPWTLCLDANRDGRLSDEQLFRGKIVPIRGWGKGQRHYLFGPFELALRPIDPEKGNVLAVDRFQYG